MAATADKFSAFLGATPPVSPVVEAKPAQQAPESPPEAPATEETRKAGKARQRAPQRPAGGNTTAAAPAVEPESVEEPDRPPLTRTQEARWEQWLQSAAGKARASREAAEQALADFHAGVAEAREAGVSEWSVRAAALRGRIELDELPDD